MLGGTPRYNPPLVNVQFIGSHEIYDIYLEIGHNFQTWWAVRSVHMFEGWEDDEIRRRARYIDAKYKVPAVVAIIAVKNELPRVEAGDEDLDDEEDDDPLEDDEDD